MFVIKWFLFEFQSNTIRLDICLEASKTGNEVIDQFFRVDFRFQALPIVTFDALPIVNLSSAPIKSAIIYHFLIMDHHLLNYFAIK